MESNEVTVEVDIPCDVQQQDETGYEWAFLDEARNPFRIAKEAIAVSGDEVDPVFARVVSLSARRHQGAPGDPAGRLAQVRRRSWPRTPSLRLSASDWYWGLPVCGGWCCVVLRKCRGIEYSSTNS